MSGISATRVGSEHCLSIGFIVFCGKTLSTVSSQNTVVVCWPQVVLAIFESLQQFFGRKDTVYFRELGPLVFYSDIAFKSRLFDDFHHPLVVYLCFIAVGVEIVGLCAHPFGKWHQIAYTLIAVVLIEVPEVRKASTVLLVYFLQNICKPIAM